MVQLLQDIQKFIAEGGWLAILLLVLASGYWGFWVFGPVYERDIKERDERIAEEHAEVEFWKTRYLNQRELTRRGVAAGKTILEAAKDVRGE